MSKKKWREWELKCREVIISRQSDGWLIFRQHVIVAPRLSPTEARRLFLALKKDYLD